VISNQPPAAPGERRPEPRTALNAVFRRLSDGPAPAPSEPPAPPAQPHARPAPPVAVPPVAPEPPPEPERADPRVSFAAAVLARAGAAIAARATREAEATTVGTPPSTPPSTPPLGPPSASNPAETLIEWVSLEALSSPPEPAATARPASVPERAVEPEPEPEGRLSSRPVPESRPEPQAEPEPALDAAIAQPRSPPAEPTQPPPKPVPRAAPAAAYVPAWLVVPVLKIAIPDSPFGRGNAGRPVVEDLPAPPSLEADTIGFVEAEPVAAAAPSPSETVELVFAAVGEPGAVAEQPPASPDQAAETLAAEVLPATDSAEPQPAAKPAAETSSISSSPAAETDEPAGVVAASPPEPALPKPETGEPPAVTPAVTKEAFPREPALPETETGDPAALTEAASPEQAPPGPKADVSEPAAAPAPPPRAARPLGAPQSAAIRTVAAVEAAAAEVPATDLPALVEPEPSEVTDTAVGPTRDDRPTMRNRRLYRRVSIDADFEIDGAPAKLLDLSMGGFAAANAPALAPNVVVPVTVRLAIDGVDIGSRMRARMVYVEAPRSGGRFIDLTPGQTAFLRYIVTWRGQSAGALGAATLLEAIGRTPERFPAATPALEPPGRAERRTPWWTRMFGWFRARGAPE